MPWSGIGQMESRNIFGAILNDALKINTKRVSDNSNLTALSSKEHRPFEGHVVKHNTTIVMILIH